jgi:hypothetical protein
MSMMMMRGRRLAERLRLVATVAAAASLSPVGGAGEPIGTSASGSWVGGAAPSLAEIRLQQQGSCGSCAVCPPCVAALDELLDEGRAAGGLPTASDVDLALGVVGRACDEAASLAAGGTAPASLGPCSLVTGLVPCRDGCVPAGRCTLQVRAVSFGLAVYVGTALRARSFGAGALVVPAGGLHWPTAANGSAAANSSSSTAGPAHLCVVRWNDTYYPRALADPHRLDARVCSLAPAAPTAVPAGQPPCPQFPHHCEHQDVSRVAAVLSVRARHGVRLLAGATAELRLPGLANGTVLPPMEPARRRTHRTEFQLCVVRRHPSSSASANGTAEVQLRAAGSPASWRTQPWLAQPPRSRPNAIGGCRFLGARWVECDDHCVPLSIGLCAPSADCTLSELPGTAVGGEHFSVLSGSTVFTPIAPQLVAYPAPRRRLGVSGLVIACALILLQLALGYWALWFRRVHKARWACQPEWLRQTAFARQFDYEHQPKLSCRGLCHSLRCRWLALGAALPFVRLTGDPFDTPQRLLVLVAGLATCLLVPMLNAKESKALVCAAPCTALCYFAPTDADATCGPTHPEAEMVGSHLRDPRGLVILAAFCAQLVSEVCAQNFRWHDHHSFLLFLQPEYVSDSLTRRACVRLRSWLPVAALCDMGFNCLRGCRHACLVVTRRKVDWQQAAYMAKARRGKLAVAVPKGTELYGVDGIRTSNAPLEFAPWSMTLRVAYALPILWVMVSCVVVVAESTATSGACPVWVDACARIALQAALVQLLGLDLAAVVLRTVVADVLHQSRWRRVVPQKAVPEAEVERQIQNIFEELDRNDNGVLERCEVAVLLKRLQGPLGKRFDRHDLDDAMREMDADGRGGVSLAEFQVWWKLTGSQAQGALRTALSKIVTGQAFDPRGSATVAVWQKQLEAALDDADVSRQMRMRLRLLACRDLPSSDGAFGCNDVYVVCEMFGAREFDPAPHKKPHRSIREHMIEIYTQANPRKLKDVDALLEEWRGEERRLLNLIREKYGIHDPWHRGASRRTPTLCNAGNDPVWTPPALLVFDTLEEPSAVHLEIFDEDDSSSDDFLGACTLELTGKLRRQSFAVGSNVSYQSEQWLPLHDRRGKPAGEVREKAVIHDASQQHVWLCCRFHCCHEYPRLCVCVQVRVEIHWAPRELTAQRDTAEIEAASRAWAQQRAGGGRAAQLHALGDALFDDPGQHEVAEWKPHEEQGTQVGVQGVPSLLLQAISIHSDGRDHTESKESVSLTGR